MGINLAVFFGGRSVEHDVSIISAVQAMSALNKDKYNILPVYISKNDKLIFGKALFDINNYRNIEELEKSCIEIDIKRVDDKIYIVNRKKSFRKANEIAHIDMALPIVHGTNGEDGSLQGWFEILGLPYVGCDVASSAVCMDKAVTKAVLYTNGISTLPCLTVHAKTFIGNKEKYFTQIIEKFGYPVIVKPANLGSSVGISKANNNDELQSAISEASAYCSKIIIEKAITNLREFTCAVTGDWEFCEASLCDEPIGNDVILSYEDKYLSSSSKTKTPGGMSSVQRKLPADISAEQTLQIQNIAKEAFFALDCSGVCRFDIFMDLDDNNKIYINEINPIPGSLSFYLFAPMGKHYTELLDNIISVAQKRGRMRSNLTYTFASSILSIDRNFSGTKGKM